MKRAWRRVIAATVEGAGRPTLITTRFNAFPIVPAVLVQIGGCTDADTPMAKSVGMVSDPGMFERK